MKHNNTLSLETIAGTAIQELKQSRRELDLAAVKVATLQMENTRLRRMTTNGARGRLLHRAAADARQIVTWRAAGFSVSRRQCYGYGMSIRRWQWGIALLRLGRVLDSETPIADDFLIDDLDECLSAIDRAVTIAESGGWERLLMRLPRGAARMPKR